MNYRYFSSLEEINMILDVVFSVGTLALTSKTTRRHNQAHAPPRKLEILYSCGNLE